MNLAASRNWLECTIKLIYFCQMLIQGYTINTSNIMMLPYINYENYRILRSEVRNLISQNITDISIPVLRYLIQNKDTERKITQTLFDLVGSKSVEVMKAMRDFPILTVKTTVKSLADSSVIPVIEDDNFVTVKMPCDTQCIFELSIFREGSSKMNVYSKKFSKQKEEFWFLIFVEGDSMSFRKFSFTRKVKKINVPVEMPPQKG